MRNIGSALTKLNNGEVLIELAKKSGLWTSEVHNQVWERPRFKQNLGDLVPAALSNEFALWTSEFGRLCELLGHLTAHRDTLKISAKTARATARSRIRKDATALPQDADTAPKPVKPKTASEINDLAEEDPGVLDSDKALNIIEMLISIVAASKEATQMYLSTISRELAFRETQAKQRF